MNVTDLKIYLSSFATYLAIEFSSADAFTKFMLTIVVIGYTSHKWWLMYDRNKKNKDKDENNEQED
jgi:hypothetical protein